VCIACDALLDLTELAVGKIEEDGSNLGGALAVLLAALAQFGSFLTSAVFVCIWVHRAVANLPALRRYGTFTAGAAVGSFFIPFLNLVRPMKMMSELWRLSDPDEQHTTSSLISLWWGAWIISGIITYMSSRISQTGVPNFANFIATVLTGTAGGILVMLMRDINMRQRELARRLDLANSTS
jgi:hypothetical protein